MGEEISTIYLERWTQGYVFQLKRNKTKSRKAKQVFVVVCLPAHARQTPSIDLCRLCYVVSALSVNSDSIHRPQGSFIQHCRWSFCCYCFCFSTFWHVIAAKNMHLEWRNRTHTPPERQTIGTFCSDVIFCQSQPFPDTFAGVYLDHGQTVLNTHSIVHLNCKLSWDNTRVKFKSAYFFSLWSLVVHGV